MSSSKDKRRSRVISYQCPECDRVLSIGEIAERWCETCGSIEPREVRS